MVRKQKSVNPAVRVRVPGIQAGRLFRYAEEHRHDTYLLGVENILTSEECIYQISAPPAFVENEEKVVKEEVISFDESSSVYVIQLQRNSLFPLNITPYEHLFTQWIRLQSELEEGEHLFMQLLLEPHYHTHQEDWISQYTDYLNGIDEPFTHSAFRSLQRSLTFAIDRIVGEAEERTEVEEMESKIMDNLYRFELRIVMDSRTQKNRITENIEDLLTPYAHLNAFALKRMSSCFFPFIEQRRFSPYSKHQLLSEQEVHALLGSPVVISPVNSKSLDILEGADLSHKEDEWVTLLPEGKSESPASDEHEYIQTFSHALRNLHLLGAHESLLLEACEEGATLRKITLALPKGVKLSEIKNNLENIQAETGIDYIDITKGARPGSVSFMFPKEHRTIVYLRNLVTHPEFSQFRKKWVLPFSIGTDEVGTPIYIDLAKVYHLLIAGSTGSGKSVFLVQLLLTLMMVKKPSELQLYMIDPKRVELKKFKEFPHVKALVYEADEALVILTSLVAEMEKRYAILDQYDVDELSEYNKKKPSQPLPYILCVIDEFADLIMINEEVKHSIVRLGQKARACGIHLICATQRPEVKIVDGLIKANLPTKISFRCSSINDYKTVFGTSQPFHLLGNGDGSIKLEGAVKEFIRFQAPVIHENKSVTQSCLKQMAALIEDDGTEGVSLFEHIEDTESVPEPIDKLKELMATTGETRISHLQKMMKIRMNTLQDLMAELVEEGWLKKHKAKSKGYELVAPEEELDKWRETEGENHNEDEEKEKI